MAVLLEFEEAEAEFPGSCKRAYPATSAGRKDIREWRAVALADALPGAMDLVRRSTFTAPDRSLALLRASIPKAYMDDAGVVPLCALDLQVGVGVEPGRWWQA